MNFWTAFYGVLISVCFWMSVLYAVFIVVIIFTSWRRRYFCDCNDVRVCLISTYLPVVQKRLNKEFLNKDFDLVCINIIFIRLSPKAGEKMCDTIFNEVDPLL